MRRLAFVGLVAALGACGPTHADCDDGASSCFGDAGPCLGEARTYTTDLAPRHLVAGDFDGDDAIDVLAVGDTPAGAIVAELHRGLGDGTFAAATPSDRTGCSAYPLGDDVDGDGTDDLLYPDCTGDALVVWGGDAAPTPVALPLVLTTAAILDADADGHRDILAFGLDPQQAPAMALVRGLGARGFTAGPAIPLVDGATPTGVRTGDLDGDGHVDAITWIAGVADTIVVRRGDGAGGFGPATPLAPATAAGHIAVGDVTAGGFDELVIAAPSQQRLVIGRGDAQDMASVSPYRPAQSTIAALTESSGERSQGALVVDGFEPEVRYYVVDRDGAPQEHGRLETPHAAQWVAAPDLDGDGESDLLVGHLAAGAFSVWLSSES